MSNKSFNDKYEIYCKIDNLISSRLYPSVETICNELKLSRSTFYDYRRTLIDEFNAPIEYSKEHEGYYYTKEFNLFTNTLTSDDIKKLVLIRKLLTAYGSNTGYDEASSVLTKLFPSINEVSILNRFDIAKRPQSTYETEVYRDILRALENNYVIDFHYNSKWEPNVRHRRVKPYQLIFDDGGVYLYAADIKTNQTRLFNLNKITSLTVIYQQTFKLPDDYRFEQKDEKGRFGAFQYDESNAFKIEFYGDARTWIKECIWADDQKIEEYNNLGKTVISFTSGQWIPIERWIMSFAHLVKPIQPDWLVDFWKQEIQEMQKNILSNTVHSES